MDDPKSPLRRSASKSRSQASGSETPRRISSLEKPQNNEALLTPNSRGRNYRLGYTPIDLISAHRRALAEYNAYYASLNLLQLYRSPYKERPTPQTDNVWAIDQSLVKQDTPTRSESRAPTPSSTRHRPEGDSSDVSSTTTGSRSQSLPSLTPTSNSTHTATRVSQAGSDTELSPVRSSAPRASDSSPLRRSNLARASLPAASPWKVTVSSPHQTNSAGATLSSKAPLPASHSLTSLGTKRKADDEEGVTSDNNLHSSTASTSPPPATKRVRISDSPSRLKQTHILATVDSPPTSPSLSSLKTGRDPTSLLLTPSSRHKVGLSSTPSRGTPSRGQATPSRSRTSASAGTGAVSALALLSSTLTQATSPRRPKPPTPLIDIVEFAAEQSPSSTSKHDVGGSSERHGDNNDETEHEQKETVISGTQIRTEEGEGGRGNSALDLLNNALAESSKPLDSSGHPSITRRAPKVSALDRLGNS